MSTMPCCCSGSCKRDSRWVVREFPAAVTPQSNAARLGKNRRPLVPVALTLTDYSHNPTVGLPVPQLPRPAPKAGELGRISGVPL